MDIINRFALEIGSDILETWANENLNHDVKKKKSSFQLHLIYILVDTLISKIAVFGTQNPVLLAEMII